MGSFTKFMASAIIFIILSFFLVPTRTQEKGFISVVISSKGLEFSKDLLIEQAVSSIIPLQLPQIEKSVKIPLVGQVHVVLSNITTIIWLFDISDNGDASIQVEGMEVGVTLVLNGQEGTLKLSVLECGCYVKDISIKLDGGASWLYQGLVDAFEGQIVSAVEDNISKKIREGIMKLDSLLKSLPKQIALDDIAALNVTFVGNPVLSNSSIEFQINGLIMAPNDDFASSLYNKGSLDHVLFNAPAKMVEISLHENVFSSVSLVFFNENYMQWVINKTPDQSLLNTAGWKYIVPQLYKQYPNEDMELNISVSSPPIMTAVNNGINITVYSDVTISVMDADEVIPVACISLENHASCFPDILINKLAGTIKLNHVTAYLKWSKIGNLHMHLVQAVLSTILKTVVVPYVNLHLWKGLPLRLPHGFTLHNSEIFSINSRLMIFSDVAIAEQSPTSETTQIYKPRPIDSKLLRLLASVRRSKCFKHTILQPRRPFCIKAPNTNTNTNYNHSSDNAEETSLSRYHDSLKQLDKLNFMKAAKILLTGRPSKKKFGLDFHLAQLFFACMPSLAVYLVAQYARYEIRRMEAELEEKKKKEERRSESKRKRNITKCC
ncbi:hypothetical protein L3X38_003949 [Prunus dulcis]|uniref:Lipid-binding serum glycoprotein C-terminal domain-containing protein n=1 Tax=Prunus dulcis TaxID=3755 RepID=A0AAD4ZN07_PRUDU|nr:hypothetical protein L3X38_003949 [Prunus dulcis]